MTKDEILKLMKQSFKVGGIRDDGSCDEWYGSTDDFLKFAKDVYDNGYDDGIDVGKDIGYNDGYDSAYYEHSGY